jgi:hypothetical protein
MRVAEKATKAAKDHKLVRLHKLHKTLLSKAEKEMGCRRESARVLASRVAYSAAFIASAAARQAQQIQFAAFESAASAGDLREQKQKQMKHVAVQAASAVAAATAAARAARALAKSAAQRANIAVAVASRVREVDGMRREEELTRMLEEELRGWHAFHGKSKKHGWPYRMGETIKHDVVAVELAVVHAEHSVGHSVHVGLERAHTFTRSLTHRGKKTLSE